MDDKLASYTGGLHVFKSYLKEKWGTLKEQGASGTIHELKEKTGTKVDDLRERAIKNLNRGECEDYSHIYRWVRKDVDIEMKIDDYSFCKE